MLSCAGPQNKMEVFLLSQNRKTLHLELDKYKHSVMINVIDIVRYWNALSSIKRNNI